MVADFTISSLTTDVGVRREARIFALELDTSLVLVALVVPGTLGVTPGEAVSQKVRWAPAVSPVVASLTQSILSADSISADWDALEVLTLFAG